MDLHDILIQAVGFLGALLFFASFQVKANKSLFVLQTLGCFTFGVQFALLGAYSGCLSLVINILRNVLLSKYNEWRFVRSKAWVVVFSALAVAAAAFTWSGFLSILPVLGTIAGTVGYYTNNARAIRIANLAVTSPCMLIYDAAVKSWGGVLNESVIMLSVILSILRFGWKALDGDTIGKETKNTREK